MKDFLIHRWEGHLGRPGRWLYLGRVRAASLSEAEQKARSIHPGSRIRITPLQ